MHTSLIKNARIVNEGEIFEADVLMEGDFIAQIDRRCSLSSRKNENVTDLNGTLLLPGVIDDQVHFREPGLTHKGDIYSESKAAVAGGVTSYMEMPNTVPNTFTQALLEEKFAIAAKKSFSNFSFFMGASNDNIEEVLKTDPKNVCGIKVFMGSSTGNMLVDNEETLEQLFTRSQMLIATHCEDEATIQANLAEYKSKYGENLPARYHPLIRSEEACYKSSSMAVALAKKHNTRLHVLHISTAKELELFSNKIPLADKKITAEACIHHLWFDESAYDRLGNFLKWNPAVKTEKDKNAILQAVLDDTIDVIATDHAPHTIEEKQQPYFKAPSGGPLVQHSLVAMLELYEQGKITLEKLVEKMSHAPAICFKLQDRGFIREGYHADLVSVGMKNTWVVDKTNILSKCNWSPFEGQAFSSKVNRTWVNGNLIFDHGIFNEEIKGQRLRFV